MSIAKISTWLSLALLAATNATAEDGVTDSEILLGMVNAQSGAASGLGQGMRAGAQAVFDDVNTHGGIHGRKIRLLVDDDGYEPDRAIDATLRMIEEQKVFALFGYVGTPTANAVLPIVKETHVPLVGLFTGAMTLRQPVVPEVINIRASYFDEAERLVTYFIENGGAKRFAVFYQDDGFGLAVLAGVEHALQRRKMDIVAKGTFQRGTTAVRAGLAAIIEAKPDVVIMVGPYTPLAEFIHNAKSEQLKARLGTVSFVGADNLVALAGSDGDGVLVSEVVPFPGSSDQPVVRECASLLRKAAPQATLGFVNLEGCITAKAMVLGLQRSGTDLTRPRLLAAMESIRDVDIGGMRLNLAPDNHQASKAVFLTRLAHGAIQSLEGVTPGH